MCDLEGGLGLSVGGIEGEEVTFGCVRSGLEVGHTLQDGEELMHTGLVLVLGVETPLQGGEVLLTELQLLLG